MKLYDEVTKSKVTNHMITPKHHAQPRKHITDKTGLHKAYDANGKLYAHDGTLYIAGTSSLRDVWDDLKIPFHLTSKSDRYQNAHKYLEDHKNITNLVGHSLGGSVALELQDNMDERNFKTNTYGAPVFNLNYTHATNRYRNIGDPVSMFDFGATQGIHIGLNPHSYDNLADRSVASDK
jgi:hypothetical protein